MYMKHYEIILVLQWFAGHPFSSMFPFLAYFCNNNTKSVLGNDPLTKEV